MGVITILKILHEFGKFVCNDAILILIFKLKKIFLYAAKN